MAGDKVRIGSGAGFAGDRWEPAVELVEQGGLDYIAFECLAERTIARETLAVRRGQGSGYNPQLEDRMRAVLPPAAARGVRVLSNMGAADPLAAGRKTSEIAGDLGLADRRCAVLLGDDVRDAVTAQPGLPLMETGALLESILPRMASANAYLGADAVASALETGAPVVVTGRVADPSLFVGPIVHALGWDYDDCARLAQATAAGHSAGMRGPGERRLLRRPRRQGRARIGAPRLPLRRRDRRGRRDHRQVCRHRRAHRRRHLHRAASLRGRGSRGLCHARLCARHDRHRLSRGGARPGGGLRRAGASSDRDLQGECRLFRRLSGRGAALLRWAQALSRAPGSPAKSWRRGCVCAASPTTPSTPA